MGHSPLRNSTGGLSITKKDICINFKVGGTRKNEIETLRPDGPNHGVEGRELERMLGAYRTYEGESVKGFFLEQNPGNCFPTDSGMQLFDAIKKKETRGSFCSGRILSQRKKEGRETNPAV